MPVSSVDLGELKMKNLVARFVKCESGATAIEYGLIAALIAVGIITAASALGDQISSTFDYIKTEMQTASKK